MLLHVPIQAALSITVEFFSDNLSVTFPPAVGLNLALTKCRHPTLLAEIPPQRLSSLRPALENALSEATEEP